MVAAVLVFSEAFPLATIVKEMVKSFDRHWPPDRAHRERRQSSGCASDIAQLSTAKYRTCIATFRNLANLGHLSNSTLETYCNMDCSNYIWNLLTKLARDCDPSNPPNTSYASFIAQTCDHGPGNIYCLEIWNGAADTERSAQLPQYMQCIQQFNPRSTCPSVCKVAEQWIEQKIGCCYRVLIDYGRNNTFTTNFWENCGYKEPTKCTT